MNLLDLFITISVDDREVQDKLGKTADAATQVGGSFTKLAATIAGAGITKAIANIVKSSVDAYSEYEQQVGGIETLFKNSSSAVINYASNAYKTAGLSANEYMATVTSFSASLLQSLDQDTETAAEMADRAITDMSDNANKMGTDMTAIQNAYQGFAKQNYTMLDNLKLGYGGTQAEMVRLISDASKMTDIQDELNVTVDEGSLSFANIVNAISVVQKNLDIAGTTAKEASTTIQGSLNSAKAAWENLLVGFSDGTQDLDKLMDDFVSSVGTAMGNILPRIKQFASSADSQFGIVADAVEALGVVIIALAVAGPINKLIVAFQTARVELALYTAQNGAAAISAAALTTELTLSEVVVGLLTGKITLATAAQAAWNIVMKANPAGLLITAVGLLTLGVVKLVKHQKEADDALEVTADTAEDTAEKIDELKAKIAELEAQPAGIVRDEQLRQEKEDLEELQAAYDSFIAEQEAAAEAAEQPAARFEAATSAYEESATALLDTFIETYEGIFDNVSSWFEPFEAAKTTVTTSVEEMIAAMQSQIDFNTNYAANLQYLKDAGLGTLSEAFQSYGADGAAYAAAIVSALQQAGGATTTEGQQIISRFSELQEGVTTSQAEVSEKLTLLSGDFDSAIGDMVDTLAEGVEGLDKSSEALEAAQNTFEGYLEGVNNQTPGILSAMNNLGAQITQALQSSIGTVTVPVVTANVSSFNSKSSVGQYAEGLNYVPYDEFPAFLHKGEAVLTEKEAAVWRAGGLNSGYSGGGNPSTDNPIKIVVQSVLDGKVISETVSKYQRRTLRATGA